MNGIQEGAVVKCEDFTEARTCQLACPTDTMISIGEVTESIFNSTAPVQAGAPYVTANFWHQMICIRK